MTGRDIIRTAEKQSEGRWTPSPGLVYPLIGRLAADGLIEEAEERGYTLTEKGEKELENINRLRRGISEQYDIFTKLGVTGKFLVKDAVDRIISLASITLEDIGKLGKKQRERYRDFLKKELIRLEKEKKEQQTPKKTEEETP